jgi:hypothetical protein
MPSKAELNLMFISLKLKNLGRFGNEWYWSSSGHGTHTTAWAQNFSNGAQDNDFKTDSYRVRACRQF